MTPAVAAGVSALLAALGWRAGWLSGVAAGIAATLGTLVLLGSGLPGFALLALFFVSGSLLTRLAARRTPGANVRRGPAQVAANGWTAALGALLVPLAPSSGWSVLAGGLAAAQADTWATEIGAHARRLPVLIIGGQAVERGASGGVTWVGTWGGVAGAVVLGSAALLANVDLRVALAATAGGIVGMLVDSVLGATLQGVFQCPGCGTRTEERRHRCGRATHLVRGRRWVTNDVVNAVGTGGGAGVAVLLGGG